MMANVLRNEFLAAGWREFTTLPTASFDGVFEGGFALCAVVLLDSSTEIATRWPELQTVLADFRSREVKGQERDYYLILAVEHIADASLAAVQEMLNDTRVCRKICLELRRRTLGDALRDDIPFFATPGTLIAVHSVPDDTLTLRGVSRRLQRDLEFKSADRILDSLLAGAYDHPETT